MQFAPLQCNFVSMLTVVAQTWLDRPGIRSISLLMLVGFVCFAQLACTPASDTADQPVDVSETGSAQGLVVRGFGASGDRWI